MKYHLAESCRNTFVLFNCLNESKLEKKFLREVHQCLKEENRDDALILNSGEIEGDSLIVNMAVLGLDGQLAEFCGNGARASAAFLYNHYPEFKTIFLKTERGLHLLSQHGESIYSVRLPPASFEWNKKFISNPELVREKYDLDYIETGEPHLLIKNALDDEQLLSLGRELNQQTDLFPFGINVNAWHELQDGQIYVKTYERGVQRLTQSCGTGSTACASFYRAQGTVHVQTPGGPLKITFHDHDVELCGESQISKTIESL